MLYDIKNNKTISTIGHDLCDKRFSPCSTFKIFNCLVGLDTSVLKNEKSTKKWNGFTYPIPRWNKDQSLKSAIKNSVVWYFKEVAKDIGSNRMQSYLDHVGYGNQDISSGITNFWLDRGSLKISVSETLEFMKKLYKKELPFGNYAISTTQSLIIIEKNNEFTFSGKTGSGKDHGWFVGHLLSPKGEYVFATHISGNQASGNKAKEITKNILRNLKIADLF